MTDIACCGDASCCTYVFGKAFRPFQLCRLLIGTENGNARIAQAIAQAGNKRCFWTDHDQTDIMPRAKGYDRGMVGYVQCNQIRLFRNPGIARRGKECIAIWRLRELPRQRMFASTRSDEQDIHVRK